MVEITTELIDHAGLTDRVRGNAAGAVVTFLGTVREWTGDQQTVAIEYEAYPVMALSKLEEIEREARARWPVLDVAMVHRVGPLGLGDVSVAIAVSCPHRAQAFDACRYLIDRVKEIVPIWKREAWSDGRTEWVHPGMDQASMRVASAGDAGR